MSQKSQKASSTPHLQIYIIEEFFFFFNCWFADGVFSHWQIHLDNGRLSSLGFTNSTSTTEQHAHHFTSLLKVLSVSICERGRELLFCVSGMPFYYMASSASGQYAVNSVFWLATRAGKMERYCPPGTARFVPTNKILPKFKQVHETFLSPELFFAKVKRFLVFSLSLWNQKKRQREWKQKCWCVFKSTFCSKNQQTQKFVLNLKIWIWNLILKWNQSNDCIFCIYPIRI